MKHRTRSSLDDVEPRVPIAEKRVGRPFTKGNVAARGRGRPRNEWRASLEDVITDQDWRDVVTRAVACARAGDRHARTWLGEHLLGRARIADRDAGPVTLTVTTPQQCVDAHGAILAALAAGRVTVEEGRDLAAIVDSARASLELVELEARVAALEERRGKTN